MEERSRNFQPQRLNEYLQFKDLYNSSPVTSSCSSPQDPILGAKQVLCVATSATILQKCFQRFTKLTVLHLISVSVLPTNCPAYTTIARCPPHPHPLPTQLKRRAPFCPSSPQTLLGQTRIGKLWRHNSFEACIIFKTIRK